ncbi:uncharacterized protein FIBRA_04784 [Fibroporia radiculosa]|uniref:Pericentrin/AKAP-450 centrosomal targeting domain-containing protein n=1 Tax=Fibroporia radiculosa TaxID=599839 RepID=J4H354_9APHY|nr:uncharacterized protein FIBRA_04784 [Fibroporia radiculosa]CCM02679.1 predicted protein [Fibroporia radiculosa]
MSPLAALTVPLPRSTTASPAPFVREANEELPSQRHEQETSQSDIQNDNSRDAMDLTDPLLPQQSVSEREPDDQREPTFSSEEAPTQSDNGSTRGMRSPMGLSAAFSSPTPSAMFTPTPAFQPRPRARFAALPNTPRQSDYPAYEEESVERGGAVERDAEVPATPYAHKRSFLLSVINSTARPRMKHLTPHPHHTGEGQSMQVSMTPGVNLRSAFAGVTPRPQIRPRLSHPLTDALPGPSEAGSASDTESIHSVSLAGSQSPIPPGAQSPYDPTMDRVSFVSTASSHDLTTHARANASFDPVMGLGERGHGVGRFNAGKLNNYLHGLNRRLQEENETLVIRLKTYEEKYGMGAEGASTTTPDKSQSLQQPQSAQSRRLSGGARRVSAGPGIGLGDVPEDRLAESWIEEKALLEEELDELRHKLEHLTGEKESAEEAVLQERAERARDKERWRERMSEVEKGVSGIIEDLERKLAEAEESAKTAAQQKSEAQKEAEKRLVAILAEKALLEDRIKKAEDALESGQDLGADLNAANELIARAMTNLSGANMQIKELEDEVMRADEKVDDLERQVRLQKEHSIDLDKELQKRSTEFNDTLLHNKSLDADLQKTRRELQSSREYAAQMETDAGIAVERIETLEAQLTATQEQVAEVTDEVEREREEVDRLADEANKASELARQLEAALEAAEVKMLDDEQQLVSLKAKVSSLEQAREHEQSNESADRQDDLVMQLQNEVESLESELDDARKEIARLNMLINQSPARKAIDRAKDARIELLEKEKEDLLDRMKSIKSQNNSVYGTPGKLPNASSISPMHRQLLSLSLKSPKTPGGPLRDLSWLQNTINDPTVSPLVAEIARLQSELDRANESIDDKLDQLEDAGLGVVGLTQQLEDARSKINYLEDEIARQGRKEDRLHQRLQRLRCIKCHTKVDVSGLQQANNGDASSILEMSTSSLLSEPPTPPTKTSEALRANLREVTSQLASMKKTWQEEKRQLLGEKAVLQDATTRLNAEVRDAKNEVRKLVETERAGEKARAGIQGELDWAKRAIDDLESELKAERTRLRTLTTEQARAQRDKDEVVLQLHRTETDITDVRDHVQRLKEENHKLEKELRSNALAEQKARLLETKVAQNTETIEQLRQERSLLVTDHKELQKRYSKASEHMNKLKDEYAASQTSHDERRHQLDLRMLEIDDLRRALAEQADELHRAEAEKDRIVAEKSDVARTVAALEADLRRVRADAEAFGRDLKLLRAQKDRLEEERRLDAAGAERAQKQAHAQVRLLKEEAERQRQKAAAVDEELHRHVCAADEQQLAGLKLQHNKECKGLIVQIRYLKAKFARESALRDGLGYQKQYLLVLLARLEKNEQTVLAAIARIGFPEVRPPAPLRKRKLRSVALSVMFILRSKRASDAWREQSASKQAIATALQEVRQRRAANANAKGAS